MKELFYRKKILILIPHQDDEINICGGIIKSLHDLKCEITVAYSTNGDYSVPAYVRYKEARKSLKKLGLKNANIVLLGYSDQYSEETSHLYMTKDNNVWLSRNNRNKTYGVNNKCEFRMNINNNHSLFNYNNFVQDITDLIKYEKSDVIFTIDFDSHPDHRALSLAFEKAMGIILNSNHNYHPLVYKSFAYPTSYFGVDDFHSKNIKSTSFKTEDNSQFKMQNPYYNLSERVRFQVSKKNRNLFFPFNSTFKALCSHKSQVIVEKAFSIINGDQVFWQRSTDSLLYQSTISVSSGNPSYLNDFMYFDCKDIMNGRKKYAEYLNNYWKPSINDLEKRIKIILEKEEILDNLVIYQPCHINDRIKKIEIYFDNTLYKEVELFDSLKEKIKIDSKKSIKVIDIKITETSGNQAGISEIELFKENNKNIKFVKLTSGENFLYDYIYDKPISINIYSYNGINSKKMKLSDFIIESNNIELSDNKLVLNGKKGNLKITLKNNHDICDYITIRKNDFIINILNHIINLLNFLLVKYNVFYQKMIRKLKRIIKYYK